MKLAFDINIFSTAIVTFKLWGGGGGANNIAQTGGDAAFITCSMSVTGGTMFNIAVAQGGRTVTFDPSTSPIASPVASMCSPSAFVCVQYSSIHMHIFIFKQQLIDHKVYSSHIRAH